MTTGPLPSRSRRRATDVATVLAALAVAIVSSIVTGPAASAAPGQAEELDRVGSIEPCVVYDSTLATGPGLAGPLAPGEVRTIQVDGVLPDTQGASADRCLREPNPNQKAVSVFITVSAIAPQAPGNLRLSPAGVTPTGGVVNYTANGLDNANTVSVPLSDDGRVDVAANAGATGVRLVVVAYAGSPADGRFVPVTPCAVADSRPGRGASGDFLGPFTAADGPPEIAYEGSFPAAQGGGNTDCGIPLFRPYDIVVNVVAIRPPGGFGGTGHLAAGAGGTPPSQATVPFTDIDLNNSTTTIISSGPSDTIAIDVAAVDGAPSTHIRVVVLGYFELFGTEYEAVTPCAVFDSRPGRGASGSFLGLRSDQAPTTYSVAGSVPAAQGGGGGDCGIPTSARAVMINLVAIQPNAFGNLRAYATGSDPTGGVLNFAPLEPAMNNSNAVIVPLSEIGQLDVAVNAPANAGGPTVHVRGVVLGYFGGMDVTGCFGGQDSPPMRYGQVGDFPSAQPDRPDGCPFDAEAGDVVWLGITQGVGNGQARYTVSDPDGTTICELDGSGRCPITTTGRHLFLGELVSGDGFDFFPYLQRLNPAAWCDSASLGETVTGVLDTIQYDCQAFDATAGQRVQLNPSGIDGSLVVRLFDPDGEPVCQTISNPLTCDLTKAGRYTVLINGDGNFGDYQLELGIAG